MSAQGLLQRRLAVPSVFALAGARPRVGARCAAGSAANPTRAPSGAARGAKGTT
jgi:hypothetical protein